MTVSRDEVFEILRGVVPRLEEALPGWSVRPNITGTGAVGLYLDGPAIYRDGEPLEPFSTPARIDAERASTSDRVFEARVIPVENASVLPVFTR